MIIDGIIPQPGEWVRVKVRADGVTASVFGQFHRFLNYDHDELTIREPGPGERPFRWRVDAGGIELSSGDLTEIGDYYDVEISRCNQIGTYV